MPGGKESRHQIKVLYVPFSAETNTQRSYFVCDREAPEQKELAHELVEMLRGERGRHRDRDQRAIVVIWDVGGGKGGYCTCYVRQCFHFQLVFDFEVLANWLLSCYFENVTDLIKGFI